jgi:hypothetical protein
LSPFILNIHYSLNLILEYVEVVPQLPVAGEFLEKEMYIQNSECSIEYEKYSKPTKYISHLWGTDQCYLSTFTTDIADPSTFVYAKASFEDVVHAEQGPAFDVNVRLFKDAQCAEEVSGEGYAPFSDTLAKSCRTQRSGNSEVASLHATAPSRNLKLNKGASVSLYSSIGDCVAGDGTLQERMSREDNCFNGVQFHCYHADRFSEYTYEMVKWPRSDCTEVKAREEDPSEVVKTKFTRAEGCQQVMPLDATFGHPMINCGQHW